MWTNLPFITAFACAYQVKKYAYKENLVLPWTFVWIDFIGANIRQVHTFSKSKRWLPFSKWLQSAWWSTQLRTSAGSQPVSIVVCPVPQGPEHGRESVNPAYMKPVPGFHNRFASKQTYVAPQKYDFWWEGKPKVPSSVKASHLRGHAHCGGENF